MRTKTIIAVLLSAVMFVMADVHLPLPFGNSRGEVTHDSLSAAADSVRRPVQPDTTMMDSLQKAIYKYNKQVDDSIHADSINRHGWQCSDKNAICIAGYYK